MLSRAPLFVLFDSVVAREDEPPELSIEMVNPVAHRRRLLTSEPIIGCFCKNDFYARWSSILRSVTDAARRLAGEPAVRTSI
ncbi:MAG: hypothetical protein JSR66_27730 [Proteobacteria bacterium]|nr:hypothetical protein [Pseudomonadota bacterium]